ncbi:MAG TPA: HipA domain-containing protein [Terriglobales bacterium]|jgi:serine/threonine-protein kinase HipA|nr:HipA domain-containing protein [Terriglobales bacterium]
MAGLDTVEVCIDLERFGHPVLMGQLHHQQSGAGEIFSFEYDRAWLEQPEVFSFDPDLALAAGHQYPAPQRKNFSIFLDSAPDRWGRVLMQRRENARARHEKRKPRALTEWDFLLGVHDETRLGALRFRETPNSPFIDSDAEFAAPPLTSLRELQAASLQFEKHIDDEENPLYEEWLTKLFAPGSSLGGARPKASVRDEAGTLCMAKFPSRNDTRDMGGWELVAHSLARKARIIVPDARPLRFAESSYTTFLVKRFDRTARGGRLAFISAMTLTQHTDGEPGTSYLELIDLLQSRGADTRSDCVQLFRRVVFNILIHNTDDHLRNHGFFVDENGIRLSPAYDVNPSVDRDELALAINEVENTCDVSIAMEASQDYGLNPREATDVLKQVQDAVAGWREEATRLNIPKAEQDLMANAFQG